MLDTNICIYLINKKPIDLAQKIAETANDTMYISTITQAELEFGVAKSQNKAKNAQALAKFLSVVNVIDFDTNAAEAYGEIRAALQIKGNLIGYMDMLIAAHAKSKGFTVITNNIREFTRVDGLAVEDWTK
jgi:tRNA(fMet)-specific endonuclease VapC